MAAASKKSNKILSNDRLLFFSDRGCASKDGFQLHGNYIDSGSGHADDARALLYVDFDGFKRSVLNPGLGSVSFEFEMQCEGPCSLGLHQVYSIIYKNAHLSWRSFNPDCPCYRGVEWSAGGGQGYFRDPRLASLVYRDSRPRDENLVRDQSRAPRSSETIRKFVSTVDST